MLTNGASRMYSQTTFWDTGSATSSPESADGASACGSPASPMTAPCGPEALHASHSVPLRLQMEERKAKAIGGILRQFSFASSGSAALQWSLENRLLARFAGDGGTNSPWRLSVKATPLRR